MSSSEPDGEFDFAVTIALIDAPSDLAPDVQGTIEATMALAKDAALQVLAGTALPASLAASVALLLRPNDHLERTRELGRLQTVVTGGETINRLQLPKAIEDFNEALNALKTRFEKEFPHAGG